MIHRLLNDCCWMNIHLIQPYGCVFEMRVPEGFGARWSHDGSKVFLFSLLNIVHFLDQIFVVRSNVSKMGGDF